VGFITFSDPSLPPNGGCIVGNSGYVVADVLRPGCRHSRLRSCLRRCHAGRLQSGRPSSSGDWHASGL